MRSHVIFLTSKSAPNLTDRPPIPRPRKARLDSGQPLRLCGANKLAPRAVAWRKRRGADADILETRRCGDAYDRARAQRRWRGKLTQRREAGCRCEFHPHAFAGHHRLRGAHFLSHELTTAGLALIVFAWLPQWVAAYVPGCALWPAPNGKE